jgi:hypothetical protein
MINLKLNLLHNVFPRNPTQTAFHRFTKTPGGAMRTAFTDSVEAFTKGNPLMERRIYTPFSDTMGPLVLGGEEDNDKLA